MADDGKLVAGNWKMNGTAADLAEVAGHRRGGAGARGSTSPCACRRP